MSFGNINDSSLVGTILIKKMHISRDDNHDDDDDDVMMMMMIMMTTTR